METSAHSGSGQATSTTATASHSTQKKSQGGDKKNSLEQILIESEAQLQGDQNPAATVGTEGCGSPQRPMPPVEPASGGTKGKPKLSWL